MASERAPVVGMWGTFDVDNYGDHLFPLVAAAELGRRIPDVRLRLAAPYGRLHPTRFDRLPVEPLPPWSPDAVEAVVDDLDCVLVGGGEILHGNDRLLAPVYGTHGEELARLRPSGWFLEAAATTGATHVPFVLNAVGITHVDDPRVLALTGAAAVVAVRDPGSEALLRAAGSTRRDLAVVPDTAFLVDRVIGDGAQDRALARLRSAGHIPARGRPLVVQGCDLLVPHAGEIAAALADGDSDTDIVVVETGRGRGDDRFADALLAAVDRRVWRLPADAGIIDIAAVIRASEAFVGSSLHGCITAAVFGRPFVTLDLAREPKLAGLGMVMNRPECIVGHANDLLGALDRARRRAVELRHDVVALQREVDRHFDRVAGVAIDAAKRRQRRRRAATRPPRAREPHPAAVRASGARVGAVVVAHDGAEHTLRCLARLHDELTWPLDTIVAVGNGSADPVADAVYQRWPDIAVIAGAENAGFPAACDAAIETLAHVDHVVVMSTHALPDVGFLEPLVGALAADPTLGAVVPKVLLDGGQARQRATISTPGGSAEVEIDGPTRVAVPPCRAGMAAPAPVAAWSGAAVLLRRAYLDDVGALRGDLLLSYEDVDHSLRGARKGWRFAYVPTSVVRHAQDATTTPVPELVRHLSARNRLLGGFARRLPRSLRGRLAR